MEEQIITSEVCIVGAGPAGAATSLMLSKLKVHHVIVDKATFPRDKTCGDGLILHVFRALQAIDPALLEEFLYHPKFGSSPRINLHVSDKTSIVFDEKDASRMDLIRFAKRIDFDDFLVQKLESPYATCLFGDAVSAISEQANGIQTVLKSGQIIASKLIVGADGIQSKVSSSLTDNKLDPENMSTFISAYFEDLNDFPQSSEGYVRMIHKKTPLFFYVFPLPDGQSNVSLGGKASDLKRHQINLRKEMDFLMENDSILAPIFKGSKRVGAWRGWGIPYHYGRQTISGNRFMLVGDAAGLANAFYKEGVGTGMMSGVLAARVAQSCLSNQDFSAKALQAYDQAVEKEFGRLLKLSEWTLKLAHFKHTFRAFMRLGKPKIEKGIRKYILRKVNFSK